MDRRRELVSYYVAIVDGAGDTWGIRFPDFPGCCGGGETPDGAIADATSALREFAADMARDGEAFPAPRSLADIIADPEAAFDPASGETAVMIPLLLDTARTVRANLSIDAGLLAQIDAEAARRGLTRSAFLASAAMEKIIGGR